MVKVRLSQIKEESSKPVRIRRENVSKVKRTTNYDDSYDEDYEDDEDQKPEEDMKTRLSKTILHFKSEGITMTAWDLSTIEPEMRFVESPRPHWEYGIVINKGLTPGQFIQKTDLYIWYRNEEMRDRKMKHLLEVLKENGMNIIEI
jgi:hypothetical protein